MNCATVHALVCSLASIADRTSPTSPSHSSRVTWSMVDTTGVIPSDASIVTNARLWIGPAPCRHQLYERKRTAVNTRYPQPDSVHHDSERHSPHAGSYWLFPANFWYGWVACDGAAATADTADGAAGFRTATSLRATPWLVRGSTACEGATLAIECTVGAAAARAGSASWV